MSKVFSALFGLSVVFLINITVCNTLETQDENKEIKADFLDNKINVNLNEINNFPKSITTELPADDIRIDNITKNHEANHMYYNSTMAIDELSTKKYWNELSNFTISNLLSKSHRRAMTVKLSFDFPFYGNPMRNVTIATGGFLYMGDYVHSWLAATQYIAPLMANFNPSLSNDSFIKYTDNGTVFTVVWENVTLEDRTEIGGFTFSASLYKTGDIMFSYYSVPVLIKSIQDDEHPVKVGLSDAYIIEKTKFYARRKTIYEYHRVNFSSENINNYTMIYLTALPTCLTLKDCTSCLTENVLFRCNWCPTVNRCSSGMDRRRQEWLQKGCDNIQITGASVCAAISDEKGCLENNINCKTSITSTEIPISSTESRIITSTERATSERSDDRELDNDINNPSRFLNRKRRQTEKNETTAQQISTTVPPPTQLDVINEDKKKIRTIIGQDEAKKPIDNSSIKDKKYLLNNRPLLGVNGTGQKKDTLLNKPISVVSEPISPNNNSKSTKLSLIHPVTKTLGSIELSADDINIDAIDKFDFDTNKTLMENNLTKYDEDYHVFYNSTMAIDALSTKKYWNELSNLTISNLLSKSHRRAMTVQLSFDFPFYGHPVRNVTVATGGFLYMGDYVHSWLAATQYIAPLMANFDTSLSNDSFVKYTDNGTVFTVVWENVTLQDRPQIGTFTFSASLYKTGDILFSYNSVPVLIESIQDDKHPVKVGLSDAYIIDKTIFFARRKTIYEYHRVNFASEDINNYTMIYLTALPTCLTLKDCNSCLTENVSIRCNWCPTLNRCSSGMDRRRQEWLQKGCDKTQIIEKSVCPAIGDKGNNAMQQSDMSDIVNTNDKWNTARDPSLDKEQTSLVLPTESSHLSGESHQESASFGMILGLLFTVSLITIAFVWILYAYRNPHTKSGQLLIQYRPSQWSWKRGEARYTAATIHM